MVTVGLTGGTGSGKSTVAARLGEHGAVVLDADAIAREVLAPGSVGLAAVVADFGPAVLTADGVLDRGALASIVFADSRQLARLEAITHPLIARRTAELRAAAAPGAVLVHDVPLLAEKGLAGDYDLVVVVEAPVEQRLARLVRRGLDEHDAGARIRAQATDEQRRAVADVVIVNDGSPDRLLARVDRLWEDIAHR